MARPFAPSASTAPPLLAADRGHLGPELPVADQRPNLELCERLVDPALLGKVLAIEHQQAVEGGLVQRRIPRAVPKPGRLAPELTPYQPHANHMPVVALKKL